MAAQSSTGSQGAVHEEGDRTDKKTTVADDSITVEVVVKINKDANINAVEKKILADTTNGNRVEEKSCEDNKSSKKNGNNEKNNCELAEQVTDNKNGHSVEGDEIKRDTEDSSKTDNSSVPVSAVMQLQVQPVVNVPCVRPICQPDWERLSNWVHCICVVNFDLELGQAIELIYPTGAKLQEEDKTNICYLAFPDSNSSCLGDTKYHIRIRQAPGGPDLLSIHKLYNQKCPANLQVSSEYFYGYVFFRQVKDITLPRGYFQKSVIVISRFPFINLFSEVCNLIAPEFFDNVVCSIEAACHDINQWPPPLPGETLNLVILGNVLQVQVPCDNAKSSSGQLNPMPVNPALPPPIVLPSVYEVNTFDVLSTVLYHMHLLWELVLTAEPIVVMASSPATSAQMVQALVSMISPLMYSADYRPYFTIHDSEFREYTSKSQHPPSIILGVTNPFFAKTLQHWPHIIKVPDSSNNGNLPNNKLRKGNHLKMLDSKPGVYTQYQPFLQKDKSILKTVLKGVETKRPGEVQSALLRRHLLELTQSFMIPLERYMGTLMPLQKNISPFKGTPLPWPFDTEEFLKSLETSGPQLTTGIKGDWVGLYRKFFRSANFSGWYNSRYKGMSQKLEVLQLEALSEADLKKWVVGKKEVEIVDMVLRIKCKLEQRGLDEISLQEVTRQQLRCRLQDVISSLPDDLRAVLTSS